MKKLEEIRLEVDSRRRTVQELTIKVSVHVIAIALKYYCRGRSPASI
jgi:hypothetical protein